jgi:replication fork clamp-binding protein CrfC
MIEVFKEDISNSFKELQENTIKQVKILNKMLQDLKMEIERMISQIESTLNMKTQERDQE